MPTYKNNETAQIYWRNILWEPGQTRALTFYVPHADLGLTETAATPAVDSPVMVSEDVVIGAGVPEEVEVPYTARIIVSAISTNGTASLDINGEEIPVDSSAGYVSTVLPWSKVGGILTLSSAGGATVRLLVEEVL